MNRCVVCDGFPLPHMVILCYDFQHVDGTMLKSLDSLGATVTGAIPD